MGASRPAWCESDPGEGPVLVVAPHGGLGRDDLLTPQAAGRRANDLHTADVARELAVRLRGARIINVAEDRNRIDLNRIGDVVTRAPWFLREIERQLERILRAHETAVVLFVHGWHVGQPRCDLGIGAALEAVGEVDEREEHLTVSPGFARGTLEPLRRGLESAGILATYGERWPAAHRNNLMRLFRRRPVAGAPSASVARWVAEGRIEAVQLELGAPLRWPGPTRAALVRGIGQALERPGERPTRRPTVPVGRAPGRDRDAPRSLGLHVFDARCGPAGLGIVMGAMRVGPTDVGARLQLFPGGQRMGIFTGHGRVGPALGVPGLRFERGDGGFTADFEGHVLWVEDGASYFRWEESQVGAELGEVSVRLSYRERQPGFGVVRGRVEMDGDSLRVDARGFTEPRLAAPGGESEGLRLVAALDDETAPVNVRSVGAGPDVELLRPAAGGWEVARRGRLVEESEAGLVVAFSDRRLRAFVRTRVALLRPLARGRHVHSTFGIASVEWQEPGRGAAARGTGFFERRQPLL